MNRWSEEEIEEWCERASTDSFFSDAIGGSEIIRQLQADLAECRKETARECIEVIVYAENCTAAVYAIRKKYKVEEYGWERV